jgi:hypothetical protein
MWKGKSDRASHVMSEYAATSAMNDAVYCLVFVAASRERQRLNTINTLIIALCLFIAASTTNTTTICRPRQLDTSTLWFERVRSSQE